MEQTRNTHIPFPAHEQEQLRTLGRQMNELLAKVLVLSQEDWPADLLHQLQRLAEAGLLAERFGERSELPAVTADETAVTLRAVVMQPKTAALLRHLEKVAPALREQARRMTDMAWARGEEASAEFRQLETVAIQVTRTLGMLQQVVPIDTRTRASRGKG